MSHYWSYESERAHRQGERDAEYGRARTYEYDRHSDCERDRAYYDGFREESRRQEERHEERRQEEEHERQAEQRRHDERQREERAMQEQYEREEQYQQQYDCPPPEEEPCDAQDDEIPS